MLEPEVSNASSRRLARVEACTPVGQGLTSAAVNACAASSTDGVVSAHLRPEEITVRLGFIELIPNRADAVGDAGFRIPDRVDHHPPIQTSRSIARPWP